MSDAGGRQRRAVAVARGALAAAVVAAGSTAGVSAALAAPPVDPCPAVMPVSEVDAAANAAEPLVASGLTVSRGTQPEPFEARVLGVLTDGIAPDVDMILVEADSPALDRVGGIWAGMSGSPVYAPDGRWIGAVAYGFAAGPSKVTGVTPAEDMVRVLGDDTADAHSGWESRVRLPQAVRRALVASADVSAGQAAAGLEPLPVPLAVSGLRPARVAGLVERLDSAARLIPYSAGASARTPGDVTEIKPGGNFAAALSYGDVTAAGVGTTTAVCDGMALAFGHPFAFRGASNLSAHTATALTITNDPTFTPFKLANIGGIVGTVDQDRLVAIRARLDRAPVPIPVTSTVADTDTGATRAGRTNVNDSRDLAELAPVHLLSNIDRVIDRVGAGRSRLTWTLAGVADGLPFTLTRENRFAVTQYPNREFLDISVASIDELARDLEALYANRFTEVTITNLQMNADVAVRPRRLQLEALERRNGAVWVPVDPRAGIPATAGQPLTLRARLSSYQNPAGNRTVAFSLTVPATPAQATATLEVRGGATTGDSPPPTPGDEAESFPDLLASLQNAVRNDELVATLSMGEPGEGTDTVLRRRLDEVVTGAITVPVHVQPASAARQTRLRVANP